MADTDLPIQPTAGSLRERILAAVEAARRTDEAAREVARRATEAATSTGPSAPASPPASGQPPTGR
ncbi:MAG TPA: hypothetical protein VNJ28_04625 [Candidatus Limnocylindrales bacterium]|nr:hypothetical protein [Candidatus Limnocylindrales bacterium]